MNKNIKAGLLVSGAAVLVYLLFFRNRQASITMANVETKK
jgi:hypothetical protein